MYPMVRTFVAIDLPDSIRELMGDCQGKLSGTDARLTFVAPQNMHITLKFIGEIPPATLDDVCDALRTIAFAPFELRLEGVGTNNPRRPRVIWVVAHDTGETAALHAAIEDLLVEFGVKKEGRGYTPHATIARVRHFDRTLLPPLERVAETSFGTTVVERISLKKSTLTKKGPVYENILEVPV
jgi:2'-5' RNA ligase